ncbi:iron ABC transporter permease [Cytophagaceae bacterium ABcell3]|nr:iron ABC transporter permease [Cytophagaceae bacterium ABcell3]
MKTNLSFYIFLPVYLTLLALLCFVAINTGSLEIDFYQIREAIFHYDASNKVHFVVANLRLPRIFTALVAGGSLALAGYLMQAMVNNPLADPYILGTASGASLGVNIAYLLAGSAVTLGIFSISAAAFIGAIGITMLAVFIAMKQGGLVPDRLLLTGIALSSMATAIISLLIYLSDNDNKLKSVVYWSLGSFEKSSWQQLLFPVFVLIAALLLFAFLSKHLNVMLMGEHRASSLGLNLATLRWYIMITASLLTASAVAMAGPLGFVGLMVPHIIRGIFGVHNKYNVTYTVLMGGVYLLACDILSRLLYPPVGIPPGIITSFLGVPFFVYLLSKKNYKFS